MPLGASFVSLPMSDEWFWRRVDRRSPDECWLWIGYVRKDGYGQVTHAHRRSGAHRWAYELGHGEIPKGLSVCHSCDVPLCCNPAHLFVGTTLDNQRDSSMKGRSRFGDRNPMRNPIARAKVAQHGERNGMAKLTRHQASEIRRLVARGQKQREVARVFGVSQATVSLIASGRSWR